MFQQRMSSLAFRPDASHPDPARVLEQQVGAGFTPDLALDLVLNDLVIRAAEATRASSAALALVPSDEGRDELVCRAATGPMAPSLGIALDPREGLSGVCLHTHEPQLSIDTQLDPRVDPSFSRRLGIRSILIVPVFDSNDGDTNGNDAKDSRGEFTGVLEVFSSSAAAFSDSDQKLLEGFAEECARVGHAALKLSQPKRRAAASAVRILPALVPSDTPSDQTPSDPTLSDVTLPSFTAVDPLPARRFPYQVLTIVLGTLTILATIAVSLLIGVRIGWLRATASHAQASQLIPDATGAPAESCVGTSAAGCPADQGSAATTAADLRAQSPSDIVSESVSEKAREKARERARENVARKSSASPAASSENDLVVYEKGKVIFRLKPAPIQPDLANRNQEALPSSGALVAAASKTKVAATSNAPTATTRIGAAPSVWLSPDQAEELLRIRTEPEYPAEALAEHRAGNVVLEVQVSEAGSVSNIRTISGDPVLAAAATEAVRNWHYQPYRLHDHTSQFQTDVTLTFTLPN